MPSIRIRRGLNKEIDHEPVLSMKMKVQFHSKEASRILRGIKLNIEFAPMHLYSKASLTLVSMSLLRG